MSVGTIKMYNSDRGYGFIKPDAPNEPDVFAHCSSVVSSRELREGDKVEYTAAPNPKDGRIAASSVRIIERGA